MPACYTKKNLFMLDDELNSIIVWLSQLLSRQYNNSKRRFAKYSLNA